MQGAHTLQRTNERVIAGLQAHAKFLAQARGRLLRFLAAGLELVTHCLGGRIKSPGLADQYHDHEHNSGDQADKNEDGKAVGHDALWLKCRFPLGRCVRQRLSG